MQTAASCFGDGRMHEDASLLQLVVTGSDDEALRRVFEERLSESTTLAVRVAYAVLRNRSDAEDIAQEALVKAFRELRSLRDPARFRGWLVRITWRMAIDHRRAASRRERREQVSADSTRSATAEEVAVAHEFRNRVLAAMDELPTKLRIVLALSAIEGFDTKEVASLLRLPEGTVKSRLHAARRQMAERLSWKKTR
jgi:RNA polymerase sigma-70 factor, ECF subfamily